MPLSTTLWFLLTSSSQGPILLLTSFRAETSRNGVAYAHRLVHGSGMDQRSGPQDPGVWTRPGFAPALLVTWL